MDQFVECDGDVSARVDSLSIKRPLWDKELRVLEIDGKTIKQFKQPAKSQTTILDTFEDDGWPRRIDDPLIPEKGMTGLIIKRRLRKTVENLNRAQHGMLRIRFSLDGTGEGICWRHESEGRASGSVATR